MTYLIEGEVVDTYGGDYTYRDVWYEIEDGEYLFYEVYYGSTLFRSSTFTNPSKPERITDTSEIAEFMKEIKK